MTDEIEAVLKVMADDAFEVLNWARRQGMKRDQQTAQVVAAYRKTLADTKTSIVSDQCALCGSGQKLVCPGCGTETVTEQELLNRLAPTAA